MTHVERDGQVDRTAVAVQRFGIVVGSCFAVVISILLALLLSGLAHPA